MEIDIASIAPCVARHTVIAVDRGSLNFCTMSQLYHNVSKPAWPHGKISSSGCVQYALCCSVSRGITISCLVMFEIAGSFCASIIVLS